MKDAIETRFPNQVEVIAYPTPDVSGMFEVEINDELIHSKQDGHGVVDSPVIVPACVCTEFV